MIQGTRVQLGCCKRDVTVELRRSFGGVTVELRWELGFFPSFPSTSAARPPTVPSPVSAFCIPPCALIDGAAPERLHARGPLTPAQSRQLRRRISSCPALEHHESSDIQQDPEHNECQRSAQIGSTGPERWHSAVNDLHQHHLGQFHVDLLVSNLRVEDLAEAL